VALSAGLVLSGCGKDDDEKGPEVSPTKLTGKTWKLTAANLSPAFTDPESGVSYSDLYSVMEACERDNTVMYMAADANATSGVLMGDEGATKCDDSDPQQEAGTWAFNENKTKLTQSQAGEDAITVDIIELSNTTMRQRYSDTFEGQTYTVVATFTAQ